MIDAIADSDYDIPVEEWPRLRATLRLLGIPKAASHELQLRYYFTNIRMGKPETLRVTIYDWTKDNLQTIEFLASLGFTPTQTRRPLRRVR